MSRRTLAAGAAMNTHANVRAWIHDPDIFKPGCNMPAMNLSDGDIDAVAAYLTTLQ